MSTLSEFDALRQSVALQHLDTFRKRVAALPMTESNRKFCTDDTLLRYLRARNSDEDAALAMLTVTLRWRNHVVDVNTHGRELPSCAACRVNAGAHCFLRVGTDADGLHVVYSCAGRAGNKVVDDNCYHMAFELERIFHGNREPGKIVWLIDFSGFSVRDINPRMGMMALPMFQNHYPERMGRIVVLDPPLLFYGLYQSLQAVIDPVTRQKVVLLKGAAARRRYAEAHWGHDPAMKAWLEALTTCPAKPGCFPKRALCCALLDEHTRTTLERCASELRQDGSKPCPTSSPGAEKVPDVSPVGTKCRPPSRWGRLTIAFRCSRRRALAKPKFRDEGFAGAGPVHEFENLKQQHELQLQYRFAQCDDPDSTRACCTFACFSFVANELRRRWSNAASRSKRR